MLIIEHIKIDIKSLEIKTKINYNWYDIIYINDFNVDLFEITKGESKIGANIYHIEYDYNTNKPFVFVVDRLIGYIEEIKGSSDKYLVVASSARNKNIINVLDMVLASIEDKIKDKIEDKINPNIKIKDYNKFRFNSYIDSPLITIVEFRSLVINISCVIEKNNEYYPEIYLGEC